MRVSNKQNKFRRYPGKGGGRTRPDLKDFRVAEAAERRVDRDSRSHRQQLELLDVRLGAGVGAVRERARLAALIAGRQPKRGSSGR